MRIKFITSSIIMLLLTVTVAAQVQQGKVSTKGRMSNGKHIQGIPLSNAIVQIKGQSSVVSNASGAFSFKVPKKQYTLQSVKKEGYRLFDFEILNKQYSFSANPIEIVLEDLKQLEIDRKNIERRVTKSLYDDLQKRSDEIEELKAQNKITEEKYVELVRKLNSDEENNTRIIKDMVDYYSSIDFDEVNDFQMRVSDLIINGRLHEADSMLRSKGDFHERIQRLHELHHANTQVRNDLGISEKAEELERKELADDLYSKYLICKASHQNDSAAYYLKLRIDEIDPNNVEWLGGLGLFCNNYLADTQKALQYEERALDIARKNNDDVLIAKILNDMGNVFVNMDKYDEAIKYFQQSIELKEKSKETPSSIATGYGNLGTVYHKKYMIDESLHYLNKALSLCEEINDSNGLANNLLGIGQIYKETGQYTKALDYSQRSLSIWNAKKSHRASLAYNEMAAIYRILDSTQVAINYYNKALEINQLEFGEGHPSEVNILCNLAGCFKHLGKYHDAEQYYLKALELDKNYYGIHHSLIALIHNNLATLYSETGKPKEALQCLQEALEINMLIRGERSFDVAVNYHNISSLLHNYRLFEQSLIYSQKALEITKEIYGEKIEIVGDIYNEQGTIYMELSRFEDAESCFTKALEVYKELFNDNHSNIALVYTNMASLYEEEKQFEKSIDFNNKALDIQLKIANDGSVLTIYSNIASTCLNMQDYDLALTYINKALPISESLYGKNSQSVADIFCFIAMCHERKGDIFRAIDYYIKYLSITSANDASLSEMNRDTYIKHYSKVYQLYHRILKDTIDEETSLKFEEYSKDKTVIMEVVEKGAAAEQGLKGEYYLLELNKWNIEDKFSYLDILNDMEKDVMLMNVSNGNISTHHFNGKMGGMFLYRIVGAEKKQEILQKYHEWKSLNSK